MHRIRRAHKSNLLEDNESTDKKDMERGDELKVPIYTRNK